jgi:hypothetical protein
MHDDPKLNLLDAVEDPARYWEQRCIEAESQRDQLFSALTELAPAKAKADPAPGLRLMEMLDNRTYSTIENDDYLAVGGEPDPSLTAWYHNVVTSLMVGGRGEGEHMPVIDCDYPVYVVPSSTPGHYHLYLNKPISWKHYRRVLRAMSHAGLIEPGYYRASLKRRLTRVRLPWIRKEAK